MAYIWTGKESGNGNKVENEHKPYSRTEKEEEEEKIIMSYTHVARISHKTYQLPNMIHRHHHDPFSAVFLDSHHQPSFDWIRRRPRSYSGPT
jgi:hypothetical protein